MIRGSIKRPAVLLLLALICAYTAGQQRPTNSPTPNPTTQQQPRPIEDDVVRITTNLVQIDAVVTKDNKQVMDLTADDFEILEDGKPKTITNFSYVRTVKGEPESATTKNEESTALTPPPTFKPDEPHRTIAFVVDDLGISMESMGAIRKQLRRFLREQMQPNDLVAIIRTGGEIGALQQFTNDRRLLERAVDNVKWNQCSRAGISIFPAGTDLRFLTEMGLSSSYSCTQGKTLEALRFILKGLRDLPGRKSMVILSENLPIYDLKNSLPGAPISAQAPTADAEPDFRGSPNERSYGAALQRLAELSIRSSVVVYGVDTRGLVPYGPTAADFPAPNLRPVGDQPFARLALQRQLLQDTRTGQDILAKETGGFLVKNSNDFGLKRIAHDQSGYYLIGYRPAGETFNRRFHHITVKVRRPGLTVRTRSGFFGMTDEEARPEQITSIDRIHMALMSPFGAADIEVRLTALFADVPRVGSLLRSLVYFSGRDLVFTPEPDGWHRATFNLAAVVFGDNGMVVQQITQTRSVRLQQSEYERVLHDGLIYQLDVPVPKPGAYQFRVAVRDDGSSLIGTAREVVEVANLKKGVLALSGITVSTDEQIGSSNTELTASKMSSPAVRRFPAGANLWFGYSIYNAQNNPVTHLPSLTSEARIYRDGRVVFTGAPQQIDVGVQSDRKRITAAGGLRIGTSLEPGEYQLQIVVTDTSRDPRRTAVQWIDFQIEK